MVTWQTDLNQHFFIKKKKTQQFILPLNDSIAPNGITATPTVPNYKLFLILL